jgi:FkbM family methyltransferase
MKLNSSKIKKFTVYYRNKEEFDAIYNEIFTNKEYEFKSVSDSPFILDCGSHIGLSIIYFVLKYPNAKIIGFEPNLVNFEILKKNIKKNKLKNVKIINSAVNDYNGKAKLYSYKYEGTPWTWGDGINYDQWGDAEEETESVVDVVKLSEYVVNKVDLIKIDIEGSEQKVLSEIKDKLNLVEEILLEYHGTKFNQTENRLDLIVSILQNNFSQVVIKSMDVTEKISESDNKRAHPTIINIHSKK